jgi:hypothetical protein
VIGFFSSWSWLSGILIGYGNPDTLTVKLMSNRINYYDSVILSDPPQTPKKVNPPTINLNFHFSISTALILHLIQSLKGESSTKSKRIMTEQVLSVLAKIQYLLMILFFYYWVSATDTLKNCSLLITDLFENWINVMIYFSCVWPDPAIFWAIF